MVFWSWLIEFSLSYCPLITSVHVTQSRYSVTRDNFLARRVFITFIDTSSLFFVEPASLLQCMCMHASILSDLPTITLVCKDFKIIWHNYSAS